MRWAESLAAGRTLTLRLDEEGDLHPFKGIPHGQRMQIAVVLVNDDEEPIGPEAARANSFKRKASDKNSARAFLKCRDPVFQKWISDECFKKLGKASCGDAVEAAEQNLNDVLGIHSKKELDGPKADAWKRLLTDFDMRDLAR